MMEAVVDAMRADEDLAAAESGATRCAANSWPIPAEVSSTPSEDYAQFLLIL